jgi:hypothetical protein
LPTRSRNPQSVAPATSRGRRCNRPTTKLLYLGGQENLRDPVYGTSGIMGGVSLQGLKITKLAK